MERQREAIPDRGDNQRKGQPDGDTSNTNMEIGEAMLCTV